MSIKVNFVEYIKDTFVHNTVLFDINKSNLSDCNCRYVSLFRTLICHHRCEQACCELPMLAGQAMNMQLSSKTGTTPFTKTSST